MSTEKDHWVELVELVKTANMNRPTELEPERIERLHASAFSRIDSMYPIAPDIEPGIEDQSSTRNADKRDLFDQILDHLRGIREIASGKNRIPALAVAAVAMISFGLLIMSPEKETPYFDLPDAIISAAIHPHIESLSTGSRALTTSPSARQVDFMTGVIQAELDVAGQDNEIATGNAIALLTGKLNQNKDLPKTELLALFEDRVSATKADSLTWFTEGYFIELIYLCAKHTLNTFDNEPLQAAIALWKQQSQLHDEISQSENLLTNYIDKRNALKATTSLASPEDWQKIVDITESIKALAR